MTQNEPLDLIISLIKGAKRQDHSIVGEDCVLQNCKYLLGQAIRQLRIPSDHWFISIEAKSLWERLTSEDIMNYYYNKSVPCDRANGIEVGLYRGSEKYPRTKRKLDKGDTFAYREVFHDEHIIPINQIAEELYSLEELTYENVKRVLDNIYICKMLKEEDKRTIHKIHRPFDYREAIRDSYTPSHIEIENLVTKERF